MVQSNWTQIFLLQHSCNYVQFSYISLVSITSMKSAIYPLGFMYLQSAGEGWTPGILSSPLRDLWRGRWACVWRQSGWNRLLDFAKNLTKPFTKWEMSVSYISSSYRKEIGSSLGSPRTRFSFKLSDLTLCQTCHSLLTTEDLWETSTPQITPAFATAPVNIPCWVFNWIFWIPLSQNALLFLLNIIC